jgi:pimeloyl-ACP methyl ester carboxylesterase
VIDSEIDIGVDGLPLHARLFERPASTRLLVFMPSAVGAGTAHRHPAFARWQWAEHFPDAHVLAIADPSMGIHPSLLGAWYMHRDADVISAIAAAVTEIAHGLRVDRIVAYGSSLGGFGALALAAAMPNTTAIAEVPQIDFAKWLGSARAAVESHILGDDLESHRQRHPHQVSVDARFTAAGRVPPYVIVSNVEDRSYPDQLELHEWVCRQDALPRDGRHELRIVDETLGHAPLGIDSARALIRERLLDAP